MDIAIQYPISFRRGVQSASEFRHIIVGLHGRVMSEQVAKNSYNLSLSPICFMNCISYQSKSLKLRFCD